MLVVSPKKVTPSNLNLNSEEVNWLKQDFPTLTIFTYENSVENQLFLSMREVTCELRHPCGWCFL